MSIKTWADVRARLDAVDPTQLGRDVRETITWARHVHRPRADWTPEQLAQVAELFESMFRIAVQEARLSAPALVRSAADTAAEARAESARRYGRRMASDAMAKAGLGPDDCATAHDFIKDALKRAFRRALPEWEFIEVLAAIEAEIEDEK